MKKILGLAFVFLFFAVGALSVVSAHTGDDFYDHHAMMGSWGFGGVFGWLFMVLVIVALVLLIIWLIRQLQQPVRKTNVRGRKRR